MIYDLMLGLPLFQGLSQQQLIEIVEKVPFHFKKYRPNDYLARPTDSCDEVIFVLSGSIRMVTPIYGDTMLITQDFDAPHTVPFYFLFGKETSSRSSIFAQTPTGSMSLDKENFLKVIESNRVMLINVLNILSSHAQKQHLAMDCVGERLPHLRLAKWLLAYTYREAKNIVIDAEMKDWCSLFSLTQEEFLKTTELLTETKCLSFEKGKLKLTDRYGLQTYVSRNIAQN